MAQSRHPLIFLNLGHAFDHLFMLLYPTVVLGLPDSFGLSYAERIALFTPGFVLFGAGSLPAGWLGDRWSRKGMLAVFFIGTGAAACLTSLANSPLTMLLGLTAIGLFASIYHPVGIAMVVAGRERVGFVLGVNGVFGNLGIAFAAVIAGALTDWVDWRAAFQVPGLVAIAVGLAYLAFDRSPAPVTSPAAKSLNKAQLRALPWRLIGLIAVITLIGGVVFHASTVSLPKLFEGRLTGHGAGLTEIGTLVTVVCAVASLSQLVVGRLIDRYPLRTVLFACVVLQAPLLAAVGLADGYTVPALSFLLMVVVFGEIPVNDALVARYAHDSWRSRVYAMKYLMSLGVASLAVPLVAWSHAATGGFATLYVLLAVLAAVVSLVVLALPRQTQPAAPALATA